MLKHKHDNFRLLILMFIIIKREKSLQTRKIKATNNTIVRIYFTVCKRKNKMIYKQNN